MERNKVESRYCQNFETQKRYNFYQGLSVHPGNNTDHSLDLFSRPREFYYHKDKGCQILHCEWSRLEGISDRHPSQSWRYVWYSRYQKQYATREFYLCVQDPPYHSLECLYLTGRFDQNLPTR